MSQTFRSLMLRAFLCTSHKLQSYPKNHSHHDKCWHQIIQITIYIVITSVMHWIETEWWIPQQQQKSRGKDTFHKILMCWNNTKLVSLKCATQVQRQRPESPTVTLTWHACKHKYINSTRGKKTKKNPNNTHSRRHAFLAVTCHMHFLAECPGSFYVLLR